jgi:riboflavin kinase/FMN adenylyltransferase
MQGKVVEGNKLGRTIGYPTANLSIEPEKLVPGNGVYAVKVHVNTGTNRTLGGMMNIGVRPTVDGTKRVVEVNIFGFDEDIYGQVIKVEFVKYLRGEVKFEGIEKLKEQLGKDKSRAEEILSGA